MYLALERLIERHIGLCARYTLNVQNLVEDGAHQMLVVDAVELHHQIVRTCDVVTLDNLRNLAELLYGILLASDIAHADTDKGAHVESQRFRCHHQAATLNHTHILQLLDSLVDSSSRNTTLAGNFEERRVGVLDQESKNLPIDCV